MSTNLTTKSTKALGTFLAADLQAGTTVAKVRDLVTHQTTDLNIGTERQRWNLGRLVTMMREADPKLSDQAIADTLAAKSPALTFGRSTIQQARSYYGKVEEARTDDSADAFAAALRTVMTAARASNAEAAARSRAKGKGKGKGKGSEGEGEGSEAPTPPEGRRIVTPQALDVTDALVALLEALEPYGFEDDPAVLEALAAAHAAVEAVTDALAA